MEQIEKIIDDKVKQIREVSDRKEKEIEKLMEIMERLTKGLDELNKRLEEMTLLKSQQKRNNYNNFQQQRSHLKLYDIL